MELSSSLTYFHRKLPKTRRYTLKCVTRSPARRQGPTPFSEIQVYDLLDLQILIAQVLEYCTNSYGGYSSIST
jgi:hypothetical protein